VGNSQIQAPQPVAEPLLVILKSRRTEPRSELVETWCDPEPGNYWLPTWSAFFLVRDNKWFLLYDEIRDFRQNLLRTVTFIDLNMDGRRDLILSSDEGSDNNVILTSQGKEFRKWGEGETSPCGC
jgi:hypothetical protein